MFCSFRLNPVDTRMRAGFFGVVRPLLRNGNNVLTNKVS
jgi:hypothetical protein